MRRVSLLAGVIGIGGLLAAVSCGDPGRSPTAPVGSVARRAASATAPTPGTCTTLSNLTSLANTVFGTGSSDATTAISKLGLLQHYIFDSQFDAAKNQAFDIVAFVLGEYNHSAGAHAAVVGTKDDVVALANGVFCFAGLTVTVTDPGNAGVAFPTNTQQTIVSGDGTVGTSLPPNSITEPAVISFHVIPDTFTVPGSGPLNTKLDQYHGFVGLSHSSETNAPFTQPVVVAVCPAPGLPLDVRNRLRLGHNASAGFEITPPADASFLRCPTSTAEVPQRGWLRSLASAVLPRSLYAAQDISFSGGVGGTAGEYSDFAPIDPDVSLSGGVGGTAGEYIRGAVRASVTSCTTIEAAAGSPVSASCLPLFIVRTPLGTPLTGVPVTWVVDGGGGIIAPRALGICGSFGTTAATTTSALGMTGVCWTLGAPGLNTVTATPSLGGDAVPGVIFTPTSVQFQATANPPVAVVFDQQPPVSVTAGSPFTVSALLVDKNGQRVFGASDAVTLTVNQNTFAGGLTTVTANAVQGRVTFSGLKINKAATAYRLTATSAVITLPNVPPVGDPFDVVAGPAYAMQIVQGDNQSAPAASILPVNPTVLVTDQFGNPVSGTVVTWMPSVGGGANPPQSVTGTSGQAFTVWSIAGGANQLKAAVMGSPSISRTFTATGIQTIHVLNQCAAGESGGDPINGPNKSYAFYIGNPGAGHTITEIQLYFSSNGRANHPTTYGIQLTTQMGTFNPAVSSPVPTTANVTLRGDDDENKAAAFTLSQPIVGSAGGPSIMVQLKVLTNPDDRTIKFNTGPCSPNGHCRPPSGCDATEVSSVTPYPSGTPYRNSVGIVVRGY